MLNALLTKGGDMEMTMECITVAGFVLAIFVAGVTVGKLVEKVERFISKKEDEEHISAQKNNRQ